MGDDGGSDAVICVRRKAHTNKGVFSDAVLASSLPILFTLRCLAFFIGRVLRRATSFLGWHPIIGHQRLDPAARIIAGDVECGVVIWRDQEEDASAIWIAKQPAPARLIGGLAQDRGA